MSLFLPRWKPVLARAALAKNVKQLSTGYMRITKTSSIQSTLNRHSILLGAHGYGATSLLIRAFASRAQDLYALLGVNRNATQKEIKMAYFKKAKECHPDLNPNDAKAKARFQAVANAYETLSDEKKRAMYDRTGEDAGAENAGFSAEYRQAQAEEMFHSVQSDINVIREALSIATEEIGEEMSYAVDCLRRRDWTGLAEVASANKFIILGVVLPLAIFLRYPPAVIAVLKMSWRLVGVGISGLVYTGQLDQAARLIWRNIVRMSLEQKKRAMKRK